MRKNWSHHRISPKPDDKCCICALSPNKSSRTSSHRNSLTRCDQTSVKLLKRVYSCGLVQSSSDVNSSSCPHLLCAGLHRSVLLVLRIWISFGLRPAPDAHLVNTKTSWEEKAPNQRVNALLWNFMAFVERACTSTALFNQVEPSCDNPESSLCYVKASAPSHLLSATRPQLFKNGPCFFHWGIPSSVSFPIFLLHCYPCANKLLWRACLTLFSFTVPLFPASAFPVVDGHLFSFPSDTFYHAQTVVMQHRGAKPNLLCTNPPTMCSGPQLWLLWPTYLFIWHCTAC